MPKRKKKKRKNSNKLILLIFLLAIFLLFFLYFITGTIESPIPRISKSKIEIKTLDQDNSVHDAIDHSFKLLGIPENLHSIEVVDNDLRITAYINKDEMDLNYANMILSGQVELAGGKVITGVDKYGGSVQILTFYDPDKSQKFIVTLKYAKAGTYAKKNSKLAIIVDDFGSFSGNFLNEFCQVDSNITFAILPDLQFSKEVMHRAAETGHETMIHIPMEPVDYPRNNPGENAIYVHRSVAENRKRMQNYIKQLPLCIGANNHMGSLATADKTVMNTVLSVLKRNDMYFIDSRTTSSSIAYSTAQEMMIPSSENMMFLDTPDTSDKTIQNKLERLLSLKKKNMIRSWL
ncbi:divergent polysaccharide deacetylase family protein [candidate division KSB1 bacterium]|nr:divergent polysaccharide deacetylase family protein [candidate division KSB1 bacterium]